jgi:hypothetical protein
MEEILLMLKISKTTQRNKMGKYLVRHLMSHKVKNPEKKKEMLRIIRKKKRRKKRICSERWTQ